ncbi:hypothetical protein Tco_1515808 [Tanacetum coccineum]
MEPSDEGIRRKLVMIKIEMKQILQVPYLRWDSTREIVSRKIKSDCLVQLYNSFGRDKQGIAQKDTYTPDSAKANMVEHAGHLQGLIPMGNRKTKKNERRARGSLSTTLLPKAGIIDAEVPRDLLQLVTALSPAVDTWTEVYMGNSELPDIKGEGDVILMLSSRNSSS